MKFKCKNIDKTLTTLVLIKVSYLMVINWEVKRFIRNWLTAALEITRSVRRLGDAIISSRTATTSNRYQLDETSKLVNLDVEHSIPLLITFVTIGAHFYCSVNKFFKRNSLQSEI